MAIFHPEAETTADKVFQGVVFRNNRWMVIFGLPQSGKTSVIICSAHKIYSAAQNVMQKTPKFWCITGLNDKNYKAQVHADLLQYDCEHLGLGVLKNSDLAKILKTESELLEKNDESSKDVLEFLHDFWNPNIPCYVYIDESHYGTNSSTLNKNGKYTRASVLGHLLEMINLAGLDVHETLTQHNVVLIPTSATPIDECVRRNSAIVPTFVIHNPGKNFYGIPQMLEAGCVYDNMTED